MFQNGVLYWITGLSGSGKTTVGSRLYYELKKEKDNVVLLDGDILKTIVDDSAVLTYTIEDRKRRAMQYARICKMLTDQGIIVICCTISMFDEVREWNRKNNKRYVEVFLNVPREILYARDQKGLYSKHMQGKVSNVMGLDMHIELPKSPDIEIVNDGSLTIAECVEKIIAYKVKNPKNKEENIDCKKYYSKDSDGESEISAFAKWVADDLKKSKTLLELGCGDGRDSIYFYDMGLNVIAVDSTNGIIEQLKRKYKEDNIYFICDNYTSASVVYSNQVDYCCCRFSVHEINIEQECEVIVNAYRALKSGGKFFIEIRKIEEKGRLVQKLRETGFEILHIDESDDFMDSRSEKVPVIRIVALRKSE